MLNKDTAVDALMLTDRIKLRALVVNACNELFNGNIPNNLHAMSVPELVAWYIWNHDFDDLNQIWYPVEYRFEDAETETEYYNQFG